MKAKNFKRKAKMKLGNLGDDIRRMFRKDKKYVSLGDKIRMNRNKKEGKNAYEGVIKGVSGTENNEEQAGSRAKETANKGRQKLIANKYGNQAVYKTVKALNNLGDRFEQMGMNVKKNKGRRRAMEDAAGPTKRNKDVMVCKEGQCQTR